MDVKFSQLLHLMLALIGLTVAAFARAGDGLAIRAFDANISVIDDDFAAQAVQADGTLLTVNTISSDASGMSSLTLRRYLPGGQFAPGFDVTLLQPRGIDSLVALSNGQTLVLGRFGANPNGPYPGSLFTNVGDDDDDDDDDDSGDNFTSVPLVPDPQQLIRLNGDGTRDVSFQPGIGEFDYVDTITPLPDGRVLVGGYAGSRSDSGVYMPGVYTLKRLAADGSAEGAFQPSFNADEYVMDLQAQPDGRLLISTSAGALFRLNADGGRDDAFQPGVPAGSQVDAFAPLPEGRVLVATSPVRTGEEDEDAPETAILTRINADGAPDAAFSVTLAGSVDTLYALSGGAALVTGDFSGADGAEAYGLRRIDADGGATVVFSSTDAESLSDVAVLPDGSFAVGLTTSDADGNHSAVLATFDSTGAPVSRQTLASDRSFFSLKTRADGGFYVNVSSINLSFVPPLGATFAPPPAPGASVLRGKPTISIRIGKGEAHAGGRRMAKFVLTRIGDDSSDIRVAYKVKGTAVGGRDYLPLRGVRMMRAGRSEVRIKVRPVGPRYGRVRSGGASVKVTLVKKRAYNVGEATTARVRLLNHHKPSSRP